MDSLWLTYAWKDNETNQVDFVIQELEQEGISVHFDRAQLLTGRRLWDQIEQGIMSPDVNAWALYLTRNSLESEPCQEELAYALDRTLRTKGTDFPLIGIMAEPVSRELIPASIATRLYVDLTQDDWLGRIVSGVRNESPPRTTSNLQPFEIRTHNFNGKKVIEVWPRAGRWAPAQAIFKIEEFERLTTILGAPNGHITGTGMASTSEGISNDGRYKGIQISARITFENTLQMFFSDWPSEFRVGTQERLYSVSI